MDTPALLRAGQLTVNPTPKFPGVKFDRSLGFGDHIRKVCQQMLRRLNLIRRFSGTQRADITTAAVVFDDDTFGG